ncbi:MAG: glycosyltransferase family 4 protein [Gammaproteobacteria bacterium]|nr:glycosyltransferase family 4 protein [Gammaproteobacteria bacterium]MCH9762691.1 glycosyltransferase family 4 protein [Gammaproteobacteria bacterium]
MKILVLSFYYPPDLCAGSFRCVALVKALKQLGHEVEVLTTLPNRYKSFDTDADVPVQETQEGVLIRRIVLPSHQSGMFDQVKAFTAFAWHAKRYLKARDYDVVFATSSRLMTAALGAWLAKGLKRPLYLDIRDIFVDTIGDVLSPKLAFFLKPLFSKIEQLTITQAARVNLVSEGFEDYFKARYAHTIFSYFTNGVDEVFVRQITKQALSDASKKVLTVLYAGNIGEGQGLHRVIPALAKQLEGKVRFKVIGDGGCRLKLQKALDALACHNVEVLPPVERTALISAYEAADVLFLHLNDYPAFYKVLPSKLFEYAAMGKPIWAGLAGYSEQFVREEMSNAAVFYPGDVSGACQAFETLRFKDEPRAQFIQKFSRGKIMEGMATDVSGILKEPLVKQKIAV